MRKKEAGSHQVPGGDPAVPEEAHGRADGHQALQERPPRVRAVHPGAEAAAREGARETAPRYKFE